MEGFVAQRPDLRLQIEAMVEHARQIAVNPAMRFPDVAGYTILGELGRGGMGSVYLARQDRVGARTVALKVLPRASALSASARARFLSEARAIARIRHAHVVTIHDVIHSGDLYAYAMERVDGASLADLIDYLAGVGRPPTVADVRRRLDSPDDGGAEVWAGTYVEFVARMGMGIARALTAVHEKGLLHRDVKPSNILLRRDGTPLLSDFGLVRDADVSQHTQQGAPEQLRG
jgi:serine/threonine-protein kinase PpkA